MDNNHTHESPLLIAPLLPGRNSWIQQYFQLSRWLTLPVMLISGMLLIWFWETIPTTWLVILIIGIPINFVGFHLLAAKAFANIDHERWHIYKLHIYKDAAMVFYPDKKPEEFLFENMKSIKLIYSGYERAFLPSGKYFSGANNQLFFQYRGRKVELRFRLISGKHQEQLKSVLEHLHSLNLEFEEYNQTSGLPVKTKMLEV